MSATTLISALDSYYISIQNQMAVLGATVTINGSIVPQPFGGLVNARDWPQTPPMEGALYLLFINAIPTKGGTAAQREYEYFLQWVWLIIGSDIVASQQEQSRANRYRTNLQVMENLNQASYPGFARKMDFSADSQGVISSVGSSSDYPKSDWESIRWTDPRFMPKSDNQSGLIYGAAAVELYAYSDVAALIA